MTPIVEPDGKPTGLWVLREGSDMAIVYEEEDDDS